MRIDPRSLSPDGVAAEDGFHIVADPARGRHGVWFPHGDQPIAAAVLIPLDKHFSERMDSIRRFHRWLTGALSGPRPRWQRFSRYQIHRFSLMLRAWDGVAAGAPR
ncbi:MAG: DUF2285 domain-containing protein, partial [Rhizobiales bacterium]|nr:DUF2285 domain-containing protein [Hyphomicrobiales bacterium]